MRIQHARKQADQLLARLGISGLPIPIENVAAHLGLKVVEASLGPNVSGLLVTKGEESYIAVKSAEDRRRKRFTIAHEIGHYVLGHQTPGEFVHVDNADYLVSRMSSRAGGNPKEVEANQFAGALLIPQPQIDRWLKSHNLTSFNDYGIESVAEDFDVTVQAMMMRLNTLGYF